MKRQGIFRRVFAMFLFFTCLIVGLLWFLQAHFYGDFYQQQKLKQMRSYGAEIRTRMATEGMTEALANEMEEMAALMSGRIRILDYWGNTRFQAGNSVAFTRMVGFPVEAWERALKGEIIPYQVVGHLGQMSELALLYPIDNYILLLQTPMESIEAAVSISQQFSLYILLVALLIALILALVFSRTISRPLIKLNDVAREMAQLNFNVRWQESRQDEIGQLGESFNFLTDQLREAFGNLQAELQKEKNLDKMRKQFVGQVSHELQTPIALIRAYTEALQDGIPQDQEETEAYYEIIQEEANRISVMVKDLLDLSQLESGTFKVNIQAFNLEELLESTLSKFQLLATEKGITLRVVGLDTPLEVMGDEYRIEQVLNNLLDNAVKYVVPNGLIEVRVQQPLEDRIQISIFNEGDPISPEEQEVIWESFHKGGDRPGTGLGLAIVKNVLELHGSSFGVVNEDKGVCFYFDLAKVKKDPTFDISSLDQL